jgi:hypothetical protein
LIFEIGVIFEEGDPRGDDLANGFVGQGAPGARQALTVVAEAR